MTFRRSFRQQTGVAPAQTGVETIFYLSRAFKKKTGLTLKADRERSRLH